MARENCKKCLHEKVCALWTRQEAQDASCFCSDGCDYFEAALTPPNEPLTLEQLQEMNGEPVYIVFLPDVTGEKLQFWALVDVDAFGDVNLTNNLGGSSPYEEVMGNIEAIYRRPPEGEA